MKNKLAVLTALSLSFWALPLLSFASITYIDDHFDLKSGEFYNYETENSYFFTCESGVAVVTEGSVPAGMLVGHLEGYNTFLYGMAAEYNEDPYYNQGSFTWYCDPEYDNLHVTTYNILP